MYWKAIFLLSLMSGVLGLPRSPRIYNVLISTKKNLSPSHALPVYEPVLRTTSLGYAFPPVYYQSMPFQTLSNNQGFLPNNVPASVQPLQFSQRLPQQILQEKPNVPVPQQQNFLPEQTLPLQNPGQDADPKYTIANLKRNPEIPDVPPPALPVRM